MFNICYDKDIIMSNNCQCSKNRPVDKWSEENSSVTDEELNKFANIPIDSLSGYNKHLFEMLGIVSLRKFVDNFRFEDLHS